MMWWTQECALDNTEVSFIPPKVRCSCQQSGQPSCSGNGNAFILYIGGDLQYRGNYCDTVSVGHHNFICEAQIWVLHLLQRSCMVPVWYSLWLKNTYMTLKIIYYPAHRTCSTFLNANVSILISSHMKWRELWDKLFLVVSQKSLYCTKCLIEKVPREPICSWLH